MYVQYCSLEVSSSGSGGVVLSSIFSTVYVYLPLSPSISFSLFTSKQRRHSYKNLFGQFSPECRFREGLHYVMRRKIQL
jgi:hypothetical protein